ncbi:TPA: hypothetical protein ACNVX4_005964 [Pseudomonas aeruginosa]|uniref:hypothetical protein n=1 Tax=Pseudomonas aeruginosa TaxID=287 RepID=UPI00093B46E7|nr:hypothetical protein [Pseudomonas aeruginosa]EKF7416885.1 hypothetical protein [Pseudomonas aeruginosa]MDS9918411.1 hypothetical protein [Pseudomonas aeruginosa]HCA5866516.1 hypothetical protein [Pseudomonas aeruginosa]HCA7376633.1 hypothetical protein [Pseudomonas aeruginosa]HCA7774867.1 hypothetical protein [Pseudomonas aeruginosa]
MAVQNAEAVLGERYTEEELKSEIVVSLTRTDLVILSWGYESVSFVPGSAEAAEFAAAERKIDQALERNEVGAVEKVALTLQDLLILCWGHESVSFVPGSDSAAEFDAAEAKIDAAFDELRRQISSR